MTLIFAEFSQTVNRKLKVLIYGGPGAGKSMFALSAPAPLIIDTESSTDAYRGRFDHVVGVAKSASPKEIAPVLAELSAQGFVKSGSKRLSPETLVIDSFSVLWQVRQEAGQKIAEKRAGPGNEDKGRIAFGDWALIKRPIQQLYTALINLPVHVIITAREKDLYDDDPKQPRKTGQAPDLEKNAVYVFDLVLRLAIEDGKRIGVVEKSRFLDFPPGTRIENPTWQTFAGLTMSGDTASAIPDMDAAADLEAAPEPADWTRDSARIVKAEQWRDELGLTDADLNLALDCTDWRKTTLTPGVFKNRVNAYIGRKTDGPILDESGEAETADPEVAAQS